jgi:concentrative nucleoside transporter, CNT family
MSGQAEQPKQPSEEPVASKYVESLNEKKARQPSDPELAIVTDISVEGGETWIPHYNLYKNFRPIILGGLAILILAWWISATVLKSTRHRWFASRPLTGNSIVPLIAT